MNKTTVIWDFGGVITSSPFDAFNRMEEARGMPINSVRKINATDPDSNAWAKFERSEITADQFDTLFAEEARAVGVDLRGKDVLACLSGDIRPRMVEALDILKSKGFAIGCITNNVPAGKSAGMAGSERKAASRSSRSATLLSRAGSPPSTGRSKSGSPGSGRRFRRLSSSRQAFVATR